MPTRCVILIKNKKFNIFSKCAWFVICLKISQPMSILCQNMESMTMHFMINVATPLWPSVGVKPNTCKVGDLESSGTPECSELDSKGQNTSHWGVLGVIGKVLKLRYRKCPRIGNSDICNSSYGQKNGRESNWQFDSRPLKVGNRLLSDVRFECVTWR